MILILVAVVLVSTLFLSAFFSGTETGLYCANRVRLHLGVQQRDNRAIRLTALFTDLPRTLLVTLVGVNLADYLFTNTVAWTFDEVLALSDAEVEFYTIALVAPVVFVFANVIPKSVFQLQADRLMLLSSGLLSAADRLFRLTGVLAVLRSIAEAVNRLVMDPAADAPILDPKRKVVMLLQESLAATTPPVEQSELIDRVLQLSEMSLQSVMISASRVVSIASSATRQDLVRAARNVSHARLPVHGTNRRQIVGIINVNDALAADEWRTVGERAKPALCFAPYDTVAAALAGMQQSGHEMAVVAERDGQMTGIVTLRTLLELLLGGMAG
jgi:CBS domain containing-hemolysin-like protein